MRIIGIDPGLRKTGYGIIDVHAGQTAYVTSGTIVIDSRQTLDLRLKEIADNLQDIVLEYKPHIACIEKVFVNSNPQSTLLLGHARGAAMTALAMLTLPVSEYTALQIKKAVVGRGHATKEQVQLMIQYLLKLNDTPGPDSSDALACAICHAHAAPLHERLKGHEEDLNPDRHTRIRSGRFIL